MQTKIILLQSAQAFRPQKKNTRKKIHTNLGLMVYNTNKKTSICKGCNVKFTLYE